MAPFAKYCPPQDRRPCAIGKLLRPNACQLHAIPSQTQRTVRLRGSVNSKQRFDLHCASARNETTAGCGNERSETETALASSTEPEVKTAE